MAGSCHVWAQWAPISLVTVSSARRSLSDVLREAQRLGSLGDRPVEDVIDHARLFLGPLEEISGRVLDLGTGAGVPGLVIAEARPDLSVTLLDRRANRTDALRRAVAAVGLDSRVTVVTGEAEAVARDPKQAGAYAAVVARGFGPPEVTVRAARPFLAPGGVVVVSEPPEWDPSRWPTPLLEGLGFEPAERLPGVARIRLAGPKA